jgi:hypothetical protein
MKKQGTRPNLVRKVAIPTLVLILWPKIALPKIFCGKALSYAKYTSLVKDLVSFAKCAAIYIPKVESRLLDFLCVLEE